jgi:hypothetical protein
MCIFKRGRILIILNMESQVDSDGKCDANGMTTTLQYVSPRLQYSVEETDGRALQIIVHPATTIRIDRKSFCWGSKDIENKVRSPFDLTSDVYNPSTRPAMCCLSKVNGGRICELNLTDKVAERGLFFAANFFLCSTSELTVDRNKTWDLQFPPNTWSGRPNQRIFSHLYVEGVKGMLFLQADGAILRKDLEAGEHLLVNPWLLVAHTKTCCVAVSETSRDLYCVAGPGTVFLTPQTVARSGPSPGVLQLVSYVATIMLLLSAIMGLVACALSVYGVGAEEITAAIQELIDELQKDE